tara:strand:+ start:816 stop:5198 length:4383 start_codon:yes stop_codon:yes gene_type:complete
MSGLLPGLGGSSGIDLDEIEKNYQEQQQKDADKKDTLFPRLGDKFKLNKKETEEVIKDSVTEEDPKRTWTWKDFYNSFSLIPGLTVPRILEQKLIDEGKLTEQDADQLFGKLYNVVDDADKGLKSGLVTFGFSVADLILGGTNIVAENSLQKKLQDVYYNMDVDEPETAVGEVTRLLTEYGVGGSFLFKIVNRFRKLPRVKKLLSGIPLGTGKVSTIAKRTAGFGALAGATDFLVSGPDAIMPFQSSKLIDTTDLSGRELAVANFKNRLLYGFEGSLIGGTIPLAGKAVPLLFKYGLYKPTATAAKVATKVYDFTVVNPASFLLSKDPGVIKAVSKAVKKGTVVTGSSLLKPFINAGVQGRGLFSDLPKFKDWRLFTVEQGGVEGRLKLIDNFLSKFRSTGKKTFGEKLLDREATGFIKKTNADIEKLIKEIEVRAYNMVKAYKKLNDTKTVSDAELEYVNEMVMRYLKGQDQALPKEIAPFARQLKQKLDEIKKTYAEVLPKDKLSDLRDFILKDASSYFIKSFKLFNNPSYKPDPEDIRVLKKFLIDEVIDKGIKEDILKRTGPFGNYEKELDKFAKAQIQKIIRTGKANDKDPLARMQYIAKEILKKGEPGNPIQNIIKTGEELPEAVRRVLGEEIKMIKRGGKEVGIEIEPFRNTVLSTVTDMITTVANSNKYKQFVKLGLEEGFLFKSEAAAGGRVVSKIGKGDFSGLRTDIPDELADLYTTLEIKKAIHGVSSGFLDSMLKSSFFQALLGVKVASQFGKTVLSPATQLRNVTSAGLFAFNAGHFGGKASVDSAIRIVMDDIFGAGKFTPEKQTELINIINRKIELGVLDENIITTELASVLKDIQSKKLTGVSGILNRLSNNVIIKNATKVYAGGDHLWRFYGHEFVKSELSGLFKNVDEVAKYIEDIYGVKFVRKNPFTGANKTLADAIDEAAALEIKAVYPTYSEVPEFVKAFRKIPFFGNFVSFPSAMIQSTISNLEIAMRLINNSNEKIRQKGFKKLISSITNLAVIGPTVSAIAQKATGITSDMMENFQQNLGPDYAKQSTLIPVTKVKDGVFKYYNFSYTNPYDVVQAPVKQLFRLIREGKNTPRNVRDSIIYTIFNPFDKASPFNDVLTSYLGESIYTEKALDIIPAGYGGRGGKTKAGVSIWSETDDGPTVGVKSFFHFFKGLNPGLMDSINRIGDGFKGSTRKDPLDELINLFTGVRFSEANLNESLEYVVYDFRTISSDVFVSEKFFTTDDFRTRGPDQMIDDFVQFQEEAFRAQYKIYKAIETARQFGLSDRDIKKIFRDRKISNKKIRKLLKGEFNAVPVPKEALKAKVKKLQEYEKRSGETVFTEDRPPSFYNPARELREVVRSFDKLKFPVFETETPPTEKSTSGIEFLNLIKGIIPEAGAQEVGAQEIQTPPLPEQPDPSVAATTKVANINPQTNLTNAQSALLSPGEQALAQRLNRRV